MANVDDARGLWPIRHLKGGEIRATRYTVDSSNAAAMASGSWVFLEDDGHVDGPTAGCQTLCIGVVVGVEYTNSAGKKVFDTYLPSATEGYAYVIDDPDVVFGCQTITGTTPSASYIGLHCNLAAESVDTTKKQSTIEADIASTGAGYQQVEIIGLIDRPDNSWAAHADVEVIFNQHRRLRPNAGY